MMLRNREGFTLIELLIVVVIIGILAAIALPKFGQTRERAYLSSMQSDLRNLQTAQEMYYNDYYGYASAIGANPAGGEVNFNTSDAVTIAITSTADPAGYEAVASHNALENTLCTLTVSADPTVQEGINCDGL
jgi:type IV pilus assembly protein PilA